MNAYHYKPEVLSEFKNMKDKNNNDLIYRTLNSISKLLAKKDNIHTLITWFTCLWSRFNIVFCQWLNFEFKRTILRKYISYLGMD